MTIDEIVKLLITQFPIVGGFLYALYVQSSTIAKLDERIKDLDSRNAALVQQLIGRPREAEIEPEE